MSNLSDAQLKELMSGFSVPPKPDILDRLSEAAPDLNKMGEIISRDQGVAAAVLKVINSPFYGRTKKISDIMQATVLLGADVCTNICNGVLLKHTLTEDVAFNMDAFWHQTEETAMCCGFLSKKLSFGQPDQMYSLGLFHNCGVPLLMQKFPNYLEVLKEGYLSEDHPLATLEREAVGTDHATLGYFLSKAWHIDEEICKVIRDHHTNEQIRGYFAQPNTNRAQLMGILKTAEHMTKEHWFFSKGHTDTQWELIEFDAMELLGITDRDLHDMEEEFQDLIHGEAE